MLKVVWNILELWFFWVIEGNRIELFWEIGKFGKYRVN